MIQKLSAGLDANQTIVVKPNPAMSWQQLLLVFALMSVVTLAVGVYFFLRGLPLVLPFSGLEVVLLGSALYISARRGDVREVITVDGDRIAVESGRHRPAARHEFQRLWVRVILEQPWNKGYPSRLLIRSHGKQLEIGRFLTEGERRGLANTLSGVLNH